MSNLDDHQRKLKTSVDSKKMYREGEIIFPGNRRKKQKGSSNSSLVKADIFSEKAKLFYKNSNPL